MSTVYFFYGIVQGYNMVKSQYRRQDSIPNRWDVIKVEVSVSIQRHPAQANFSGTYQDRQRDEVIMYIIHSYTK